MEVVVARFKPFYIGLFLAMFIVVSTPVFMAPMCGVGGVHGGCSPLRFAGVIAAAVGVTLLHEAVHVLVARLLGVKGLRVRLEPRLGAVMVDYDYVTPRQYLLVALAPQVLTPLLVYAARLLQGYPGMLACIAGLVNLAGGAPDVVNGLYFYLVHGDAERFRLLYGPRGVEGGVVEYRDRLVVYTF